MKIGIDATTLAYQGAGVTNYTYNLIKNLLLIDKKNQYHLFYTSFNQSKNQTYLNEFKKLGAIVHQYNIPLPVLHFFWGSLNLIPIDWFIGKMDVFYFSDFLRPPISSGTIGITTVHDLVWKLYPGYHEKRIVDIHDKKLTRTIKNNDTIITDSQTTKKDLIKLYPFIDKNKIFVIYPGISDLFKTSNKNSADSISKYLILNTKYLLYVGAIEPRKNLITAVEVFSELIKDNKYSDYQFYISGKAGWRKEELIQKIKDINLEDKIKLIGYVEDKDLPALYSKAKLTVYLSNYEGFGLPPLESLACGTPVVAGDNSSLNETLPKELLVDVDDKKAILEKMKEIMENNINIDSGAVKKRFDWSSTAKEFLKIIQGLSKKI